jgi:hypothetical protein
VLLTESRRSATSAQSLPFVDRALLVGWWLLIAWGALAFGAVYPWAYTPLFAAAAIVGGLAHWRGRHSGPIPTAVRLVVVLLLIVGIGAAAQLVPLSRDTRLKFSPASDAFLSQVDVAYAAAVMAREQGFDNALVSTLDHRPLSIDPGSTRRALLMFGCLLVLFLGTVKWLGKVGTVHLTRGVIALGVLLAVIGIVQKAMLGDHAFAGMKIYGFWEPRYKLTTPFGPFVNKNHYAGWMVMALPLAMGHLLAAATVWLHRVRPGWRHRLLALSSPDGARLQLIAFAIVLMGLALALTMSRSGIGCFVLAGVIAAVAGARGAGSLRARVGMVALVLALIAVAFAWADVDVTRRFTSGSESVRMRREAWRDAAAIVRDFPLVGTGLNTYGTATLTYKTAQTDLHFREAHNDYLQLAAEGGVLLGVPLILALVCCMWAIRQRLAEDRYGSTSYWLRVGAATGLLAIALQSIVEFSLQMPGNAVLFTLLCAMTLYRTRAADGAHRPSDDLDRHQASASREARAARV